MKKRWKEYVIQYNKSGLNCPEYSYPIKNQETENKLNIQDAGKINREQNLYTQWLRSGWEVAIDYGCGTGTNLCCFDTVDHRSRLLIGIEPDRDRISVAEKLTSKVKFVELVLACADISLLEQAPEGLFVDIILCNQVLGHVPVPEIARIIGGFALKLQSGGKCAISIPVVGNSFIKDSSSHGWEPGSDFYHYVDYSYSPFDEDYRTRVQPDVFDGMAAQCKPGLLPVHSFWLPELSSLGEKSLPVEVQSLPPSLTNIIDKYFRISKLCIYSVHKTQVPGYQPAIGDMLISMIRI
jgi:SAM-dependent methyltransferase